MLALDVGKCAATLAPAQSVLWGECCREKHLWTGAKGKKKRPERGSGRLEPLRIRPFGGCRAERMAVAVGEA